MWISILTSSKGQRNLYFKSSNSLESDGKYKELTMKGLEDLFFTSGNSLEAISLERESTVVVILCSSIRKFCGVSVGRDYGVNDDGSTKGAG